MVAGYAVGGGHVFHMVRDLTIAADNTIFGQTGPKVDSGLLANNMSRNSPESNLSNPSAITSLSFMKGVLPKYLSSEWSVAQFHLQEGLQLIVAFGHQKNVVVILGMDGRKKNFIAAKQGAGEVLLVFFCPYMQL